MASIDVEKVLAKLTIREKIKLLAGSDFWHTTHLHEHGVPALRMSDGPNGVRGTKFFNGTRSACLPCGTALGATWDTDLLYKAGELMGDECHAKGAHILLGPTINMQRGPLGGRGFESLSEDPLLAGFGAAALVAGVQSKGIGATLKHFVCNDQEHERMAYDALVTDRALREIYLRPFQIATRESKPWLFMTCYNKVNGTHCSESKWLLDGIVRKEWGFDGLFTSDWFGTYSTSEAVNAGLDLEMPGPTRWRDSILNHATFSQKITEDTIDDRARKVLELVNRCAVSGIAENSDEKEINTPEVASLLRTVANSSIVLMKNEGELLPLKKDKTTLVVGPNADVARYCGGGSASLAAYYAVTPFDGIKAKLSDGTKIHHSQGSYAHKELPLLGLRLKTDEGRPGMTFRTYNEPPSVKDRKKLDEVLVTNTDMFMVDYMCPGLDEKLYYGDIEGYLTADEDGEWELGLCVYGTANLYVDDKLVIDNETTQRQGDVFFGTGTKEEKGTISVKKDQTYHIKVQFASGSASKLKSGGVDTPGGAVRLGGCKIIDPKKAIADAAELAKTTDQVIICAGLNSDWEFENTDREIFGLPGHQDELIAAVAAANPNTVVVLQSGTPVAMPWLSNISALVQAWYGGNETGNAIADVLFGDVNPSGKLPLTFPKRLQDNPSYLSYRSERGRTLYSEDIYVGYRYFDTVELDPLFAFGHGLSYTKFALSDLRTSLDEVTDGAAATTLRVTVSLENVGEVAGAETVQVYIHQRAPSIRRPRKELKGFAKMLLQPGEKQNVEIVIKLRDAASFWDERKKMWIVEKDVFDVLVGTSGAETESFLTGEFEIKERFWWKGL